MSDTRSISRYAALLLGGSVLVVGVLVLSGIHAAKSSAKVQVTASPVAVTANQAEFQEWVDDRNDADGKLIGEIQHNGKTVELRLLPEGARHEPANQDSASDEPMADQNVPAR